MKVETTKHVVEHLLEIIMCETERNIYSGIDDMM